jgi:Flp pilus assembly protein TadD
LVYHDLGRSAEADAALGQLIETAAADAAYQIASLYTLRGETDAAFEWLERAYAQRDAGLQQVRVEPTFRPLQGDRRWGPFLERMGLAG